MALGMVACGTLAGQPAQALNIQSFELRWQSRSTPMAIHGQIKIDLGAVLTNRPFDTSGSPAGLPAWLVDLVVDVPGTGPSSGVLTRSDGNGLIW